MSLDLYVWDPTIHESLPGNYAEALTILNHLLKADSVVNPRFLQFAERLSSLIKKLPVMDEELLNFYKDFVEETRQYKRAVYVVGLPSQQFIEAIRLIVQSAGEVGLIVYYGPPETVFLPNGSTLPAGQLMLWQSVWQYQNERFDDFPTTIKSFKDKVEPLIGELASKHGFSRGKYPFEVDYPTLANASGYLKAMPYGSQFFFCMYDSVFGEFRVRIDVYFISEIYKEIISKFDFKYSNSSYAMLSLSLSNFGKMFEEYGYKFSIGGMEDLFWFLAGLDKLFFAFVAGLDTIDEIEACLRNGINGKIRLGSVYPRCLILAKMTGNNKFDEIAARALQSSNMSWGGEDKITYKQELPKLIQYLNALSVSDS